jgi:hypothetical protein
MPHNPAESRACRLATFSVCISRAHTRAHADTHHAQVEKGIPDGLTAEQWQALPSEKDLLARIDAIDGARLAADIMQSLQPADLAALEGLIQTHTTVDQTAVQRALDQCNRANGRTVQGLPGHFIQPPQEHHAAEGATSIVLGTFPTTTVMGGESRAKTLSDVTNATVSVSAQLNGSLPEHGHRKAVLCNMMPTTLPDDYTQVPQESDFELFAPAVDELLLGLFGAGLQVVYGISDKIDDALRRVLDGREVTLLVLNGTRLVLRVPTTGKPVLAIVPFEHISHAKWHAMKLATRLWQLLGLLAAHAAAAALLGREPPRIVELRDAVVAVQHIPWYKGGAYMEAVMKAKLSVYVAAVGVEEGTRRWQAWYTGRKCYAGASGKVTYRHTYMDTACLCVL